MRAVLAVIMCHLLSGVTVRCLCQRLCEGRAAVPLVSGESLQELVPQGSQDHPCKYGGSRAVTVGTNARLRGKRRTKVKLFQQFLSSKSSLKKDWQQEGIIQQDREENTLHELVPDAKACETERERTCA